MKKTHRRMVIGGAIVAGLVSVLCVVDLLAEYPWRPFAGQTLFDIVFLVSSGLLGWMCWDTWQDLDLGERPQRSARKSRPTVQKRNSDRNESKPLHKRLRRIRRNRAVTTHSRQLSNTAS